VQREANFEKIARQSLRVPEKFQSAMRASGARFANFRYESRSRFDGKPGSLLPPDVIENVQARSFLLHRRVAENPARFVTGKPSIRRGKNYAMGRQAHNQDRAGVTVTLPRALLDHVADVARIHGGGRAFAIELLLLRGLATRQTKFEQFDAVRRAALRGRDHGRR
jgi:hypothetical protein